MDLYSEIMMLIGECLLDSKRVGFFKKAIGKTIKKGDIVLDGGTGSGIMAILAAKAGADKVHAIEFDYEASMWAKNNVKNNNLTGTINVINGDLKKIKMDPVDVVVMEVLDTWLISEQQVPALNNLHRAKITKPNTQFIPSSIENYLQFCNYDFNFYGADMPMIIQARNSGVKKRIKKPFSDKILINNISFSKINELDQKTEAVTKAKQSGTINAIVITSKTTLCPGISCWETTDMNMPVIIPTTTKKVSKGEKISFSIGYKISHGFNTLKFQWE